MGENAVLNAVAREVTVTITPHHTARLGATHHSLPATLQRLGELVQKTCVPASDHSHRGAGTEGSDNH